MDQQAFRIPKQTDAHLVAALAKLRAEMRPSLDLIIKVDPHHGGSTVELSPNEGEDAPGLQYVLGHHSQIMPRLYLFDPSQGKMALRIERRPTEITDLVHVYWDEWGSRRGSQDYVKLMSFARKELRALDTEAAMTGATDSEWSRYRDAQQAVLNSLAETQKSLLGEFQRHRQEFEAAAQKRHERLEEELRAEIKAERERLDAEHSARAKTVNDREAALVALEKSFNTKEARYVARQEQQKQLDQIQKWLEGWSLTKGTRSKRLTVAIAYGVALCVTAGLTVWFSSQTVEILKNKDFTQVMWWQWTLLTIKSILPFAAFTTFLIYFIRWSADWARQHSEEEFRNRARALDIGRSTWLLEAVRDAQDKQQQLPPDLLKELSRNLFVTGGSSDGDVHPQAITDLLTQGLSSIRVKTPEGGEVEATRDKKK
jgi:hypothetical protein